MRTVIHRGKMKVPESIFNSLTFVAAAHLISLALVWMPMMLTYGEAGSAIGCFVCSSVNGSDPGCEDRFNNTGDYYQAECFSGRKGRSGLFPGTQCIKMKAELPDEPYTILVRACAVDNGDINSETEIGRVSHCGLVDYLKYDGRDMQGCILTCHTDGCNTGYRSLFSWDLAFVLVILILLSRGRLA